MQLRKSLGRRHVIAAATLTILSLGCASSATLALPAAHASRSVSVSETARLHLVSKSGSRLTERGTASGTLPGPVDAHLVVEVTEATGTVTIHPRGGSLTLSVESFARSSGTIAHLRGTLTVKTGTGRYAHARGSANFTATVNRRSWAIRVSAHGHLSY